METSDLLGVNDDPLLFALDSSHAFGQQVAQRLGVALGEHEEREFDDGEHQVRPLAGVRGRDVYVIQSQYGDARLSPADKLCRLLLFIGALKDAAAARVTAVVPCLAYARQERRSGAHDVLATRHVAALFEAAGVDAVMTLDVHNLVAFQNAFRCRTEHLEAGQLFVKYLAPLLRDGDSVVLAPDTGAVRRAEQLRRLLAAALGRPVAAAFVEKPRGAGPRGEVLLAGEVSGKQVLIVDDIIGSGATLAYAARACRSRGAARVLAAATHGQFTGEAEARLAEAAIERIVVTDSVPPFRLEEGAVKARLAVLSCSALFADAIAGGAARADGAG